MFDLAVDIIAEVIPRRYWVWIIGALVAAAIVVIFVYTANQIPDV